MFRIIACLACFVVSPTLAQTTGDDLPSVENWWDRVGAGFFSDEGLTTLRPLQEIQAHWTALSSDDQALVLERCSILADQAGEPDTSGASVPSEKRGSNTELGGTESERALHADSQELPADEGTQRADNAPDIADAQADQTTITGAMDGQEIQVPADDVTPYTGLAGGMTPDDAQMRPVCDVVISIANR